MSEDFKIEQKLGIDKIRKRVASLCSTQSAKKKVEELRLFTSPSELERELNLTEEMRSLLLFDTPFPDSGYIDILPLFKRLEQPSAYLDSPSLQNLRVGLATLRSITNYFRKDRPLRYPNLNRLISTVALFPTVDKRLDSLLDRFGNIRDSASPQLGSIRKSIKEREGSLSKLLKSLLAKGQQEGIIESDATLSVREGKVLLPVDVGSRRKIAGYVVDQSGSGRTIYVEPIEAVELNNHIKELIFAQQREIERILIEFSTFLRDYLPELTTSFERLCDIEFIRAKALYAIEIGAAKPILNLDGELIVREGRHPLLEEVLKREGREIVPLTLSLNREKRILLISGPNAGGKSIALKSVGVLQYMFQMALLVPASQSSEFPLFQSFFVEIGDEQSLENDLSTYSSHLKNMREIVTRADRESLVLIDEFGSGTEPMAGGAIAEALLEELERRGSFGVVTTHYTNLKLYAGSSKGVINGGMLFDTHKIEPLFKLEIGTPGISFAFELAKKMGIPEAIVAKAQKGVGPQFVEMERQLRRVSRSRRRIDLSLKSVGEREQYLTELTNRYEEELKGIKQLKREVLKEAKEEASRLLSGSNKIIEKTIREIREGEAEREKTKRAREELESFKKRVESKEERPLDRVEERLNSIEKIAVKERRAPKGKRAHRERKVSILELKVGDKVRVAKSGVVGEVVEVSGKQVTIAAGSLLTRLAVGKVERLSNREYSDILAPGGVDRRRFSVTESAGVGERRVNFKPTIDLRGERVEGALERVTSFVDDAIMVGVGEIKILHGKGDGILKEEIRRHLKSFWGILSYRDEAIEMGGAGITVVDLTNYK